MEIESMYIIGDFSVRTEGEFTALDRDAVRYSGDFVISKPQKVLNFKTLKGKFFRSLTVN